VIGHQIDVIRRNQEGRQAIVLDIDENGGLIVQYKNNEREILHSGEISIRKKDS
jgi:biotin-(acetyl-CoA carboxylase) ligase